MQRTTFPENHQYVPESGWTDVAYTVLRAGKAITTCEHRIERRVFPGQDILFCKSGRGVVASEGRTARIGPGQLAWLANETPHGHWPEADDPWTVFFVRIDGPDCPAVRRKVFGRGAGLATPLAPREIEAWFGRLFETLRARGDGVDLTLNRLVAELVDMIARPAHAPGETRYPQALRALLSDLRREPEQAWHAEDMAASAGLSAAQTRRLFQKHLQVSPRRWLIRERIMKAQKLLLESDAAVTEVAERCGFSDVYHFSREFKRGTGASPAAWRRAEGK